MPKTLRNFSLKYISIAKISYKYYTVPLFYLLWLDYNNISIEIRKFRRSSSSTFCPFSCYFLSQGENILNHTLSSSIYKEGSSLKKTDLLPCLTKIIQTKINMHDYTFVTANCRNCKVFFSLCCDSIILAEISAINHGGIIAI